MSIDALANALFVIGVLLLAYEGQEWLIKKLAQRRRCKRRELVWTNFFRNGVIR